uniref:Uncharacterized protein n=1 Tax=Nymphaea colorata TaxID=210225 RepID=A0A5K1H1T8_9MAGN
MAPLGEGRLSQNDGPTPPEPGHHAGVRSHHRAQQRERPRRGVEPVLRGQAVLEQHRYPVQRRAGPVRPQPPLLVGLVRQGQRIRVHLDDGPEPRVELANGTQVVLHHLPGGELLAVEGGPYLVDRRLLKFEPRRPVSSIYGGRNV